MVNIHLSPLPHWPYILLLHVGCFKHIHLTNRHCNINISFNIGSIETCIRSQPSTHLPNDLPLHEYCFFHNGIPLVKQEVQLLKDSYNLGRRPEVVHIWVCKMVASMWESRLSARLHSGWEGAGASFRASLTHTMIIVQTVDD